MPTKLKIPFIVKQFIKEVIEAQDNITAITRLREDNYEITDEAFGEYPPELKQSLSTIPTTFLKAKSEGEKQTSSLDKIIAAARKGLGKAVGEGSSRIVYSVSPDRILKVAMNDKGLAQNKAEVEIYDKGGRDPDSLVAQIFEYDGQYRAIEMEKAITSTSNALLEKAFENVSGIKNIATHPGYLDFSSATLPFALNKYLTPDPTNPNKLQLNAYTIIFSKDEMSTEKAQHLVGQFKMLINKFHLVPLDLAKEDSWGVVRRDGQLFPVLIDYGLSEQVFQKHYATKWNF
jgi:hypothetical protein